MQQAKEWLAGKCFLCTPDATKHGSLYTVRSLLQLAPWLRGTLAEEALCELRPQVAFSFQGVPRATSLALRFWQIVEGVECEGLGDEKAASSERSQKSRGQRQHAAAEKDAGGGESEEEEEERAAALASASRKQLAVLVPCVFLFAGAVCLYIDSPTLHREVDATLAEVLAPFASTDPFLDYHAAVEEAAAAGTDAATAIAGVDVPEVWRISEANCNASPPALPQTPPSVSLAGGGSSCPSHGGQLPVLGCKQGLGRTPSSCSAPLLHRSFAVPSPSTR